MISLLILVGLGLFTMQLALLAQACLGAWRRRQYRSRSGVPLLGSLLLTLGLLLSGIFPAWWPIPVELLCTVMVWWLFWKVKPEREP